MASRLMQSISGSSFWKEADFLHEKPPKEAMDAVGSIRVNQRTLTLSGGVTLAYRESTPGPALPASGTTVLLLHGQMFSAKTWHETIPTMQTLASFGHRVFAVDLPGFGNTPKNSLGEAEFLTAVIDELSPDSAPVIVSPSMSGKFSLPLLMSNPGKMCGYVPVAPVFTDKYGDERYGSVSVPTLIVMGELDTTLGAQSKAKLSQIPTASKAQIIPKARHPCYLDDPDRWHTMLYNFLRQLNC